MREENKEVEEVGIETLPARGFGVNLLTAIDVTAVKDFLTRLVQEDNLDDLKESGKLILEVKDKLVSVLCRVFDWEDLESAGSRSVPDPIVEATVAEARRIAEARQIQF